MTFFLQAELTTNDNGIIETSRCETLFAVELLKETEKETVIYDKEVKIHFAVAPDVKRIYEIAPFIIFLNSKKEKETDCSISFPLIKNDKHKKHLFKS